VFQERGAGGQADRGGRGVPACAGIVIIIAEPWCRSLVSLSVR